MTQNPLYPKALFQKNNICLKIRINYKKKQKLIYILNITYIIDITELNCTVDLHLYDSEGNVKEHNMFHHDIEDLLYQTQYYNIICKSGYAEINNIILSHKQKINEFKIKILNIVGIFNI